MGIGCRSRLECRLGHDKLYIRAKSSRVLEILRSLVSRVLVIGVKRAISMIRRLQHLGIHSFHMHRDIVHMQYTLVFFFLCNTTQSFIHVENTSILYSWEIRTICMSRKILSNIYVQYTPY